MANNEILFVFKNAKSEIMHYTIHTVNEIIFGLNNNKSIREYIDEMIMNDFNLIDSRFSTGYEDKLGNTLFHLDKVLYYGELREIDANTMSLDYYNENGNYMYGNDLSNADIENLTFLNH
jgi:hypothetical protein